MDELLRWGESEGIFLHPDIEVHDSGRFGTCGTARRDIAATRIAAIPFSACLTPRRASVALQVPFSAIARENLEGPVLALYLLTQRHTPSPWRTYLDSLPPRFTVPYYWSPSALHFLQGTELEHEPGRRLDLLRRQLDALLAMVEVSRPPEEEWVWAMTVLSTRSFPSRLVGEYSPPTSRGTLMTPGRDERDTASAPDATQSDSEAVSSGESHPILVPVLDTFNHADGTRMTWLHDAKSQSLEFITDGEVRRGEEVFNNYGGKSSAEFIMGYGFYAGTDVVTLVQNETRYALSRDDPVPASLLELVRDDGPRGLLALRRVLSDKVDKIESVQCGEAKSVEEVMAQKYRLGQIAVLRAALTKLESMLHGVGCVDLSGALEDSQFGQAVDQCFGVHSPVEAEEAGISDVILALYIIHKEMVVPTSSIDEEMEEQIDNLWEQVNSCRLVVPKVFGNVSKEQFTAALSLIWLESVDVQGNLTLLKSK